MSFIAPLVTLRVSHWNTFDSSPTNVGENKAGFDVFAAGRWGPADHRMQSVGFASPSFVLWHEVFQQRLDEQAPVKHSWAKFNAQFVWRRMCAWVRPREREKSGVLKQSCHVLLLSVHQVSSWMSTHVCVREIWDWFWGKCTHTCSLLIILLKETSTISDFSCGKEVGPTLTLSKL